VDKDAASSKRRKTVKLAFMKILSVNCYKGLRRVTIFVQGKGALYPN
jgi:hypothetical protein